MDTAKLSQARWNLAATSVGDVALFGGGFHISSGYLGSASAVVDIYNPSLSPPSLSLSSPSSSFPWLRRILKDAICILQL